MTKRSVTKKPKLTQWFDGSKFVPYHVGEYNASIFRAPDCYRWWDGVAWSKPYEKNDPLEIKKSAKKIRSGMQVLIEWRGLAQNPEVQP